MTAPKARGAARVYVFAAIAVVLAALFIRLGFWQIRRLGERRARNAAVAARLANEPVPFEQLPDSGATYRRATVHGVADYEHEIVLTGRSRDGSPGVYIVTPVRLSTNATVLVNRGWVYAPDAATVQLPAWRESRDTFVGYVDTLRSAGAPADTARRRLRTLSLAGVRALVPYDVGTRYLVVTEAQSDSTPARLRGPALDDGPHLSYAIQWFAFATIALVGAAVVVRRARSDAEPEARRLL